MPSKMCVKITVILNLFASVAADVTESCSVDTPQRGEIVQKENVMIQMRSSYAQAQGGNASMLAVTIETIFKSIPKLKEYAQNPALALADPELRAVVIEVLKEPLERVLGGFKEGGDVGGMVTKYLSCASQTNCGECTNEMAPCYWCLESKSCHPVGSQQLKFAESGPDCTKDNCKSQWPSSTCRGGYCPDGSSVGIPDGPCSTRMDCGTCLEVSNCFWCGISMSCHQVGSRYYDRRCTKSNCQSKAWYSSCDSKSCADATAYEPLK